jgi:hypothetical protein
MIEIDGLTKRYGDKTAVDRLSFVVEPGVVTGFLGPNGAGKSTTMRMIAGLDRPTTGTVAAALLGQPQTVVLDEPVNGLDPDGVRWIRLLLKSLAAEGRTVFVSSYLGCGPAPAASCSKTPRPLTWSPPSIPSPPATPSSRRPPRPASSTSSPPAQGQKHPAATPPPSYGRPLPAASKTSSPASRRACPTARSRTALFLSEGTVKIHVGRILAKLGLRDRVQAVVLAYESGVITPGTPPPDAPGAGIPRTV